MINLYKKIPLLIFIFLISAFAILIGIDKVFIGVIVSIVISILLLNLEEVNKKLIENSFFAWLSKKKNRIVITIIIFLLAISVLLFCISYMEWGKFIP